MRVALPLLFALFASGCTTTNYPRLRAPEAPARFSCGSLDTVLEHSVDEGGHLDQQALLAQREALDRYYALASAVGPGTHPELFPEPADRVAYWLNGYVMAALVLIAEHGPLESVTDVLPPWHHRWLPAKVGFFSFERVRLDGQSDSLHELEQRAADAGDPRLLFALACGASSRPPFPRQAYRGDTLDEQLDEAGRRFVTDENCLRIDDAGRAIHVSELLLEHFAKKEGPGADSPALQRFLAGYAPPALAARLAEAEAYALAPLPEDWALRRTGS